MKLCCFVLASIVACVAAQVDPTCVDKVDCITYGDKASVCEGAYKPWASDNCKNYCGFCTGPVTPAPPCVDTAPVDCALYGNDVCTSETYKRWAKEHCRRHCGYCTYTGMTTSLVPCIPQVEMDYPLDGAVKQPGPTITSTPAATTTLPFKECVDKRDCGSFGKFVCTSPDYKPWAEDNCANYCGFCVGPTTPPPPCVDVATNCDQHDRSICTSDSYKGWAGANCRRWCGFCTYTGPTTAPPTLPPTTTVPPALCKDKIDNCKSFGDYGCKGEFEPWARNNCQKTCGFCVGIPEPPLPCVDMIPNCDSYDESVCTSEDYKGWAGANCRKYCKQCTTDVPSNVTTTTVAPVTESDKVCSYKGNSYKHGEVWADGCALVCKCIDARIGHHLCKDRCPKWSLGPGCEYIDEPGQCCPKVRCGTLDENTVG